MIFSDVCASVKELGDGRDFLPAEYKRWADRLRRSVATNFEIAGFHGIYFFYREATVLGGSVALQTRYLTPDDFISDLNVFYDGKLLVKGSPKTIDIAQAEGAQATVPTWVSLRGQEFEILPAPSEAGKEIKLLYCGFPDEIPTKSPEAFEDFFLKRFDDLHVFGMGVYMALRIGLRQDAADYMSMVDTKKKELMLHNRRHWLSCSHIRFQNWDEYVGNARPIVFPQFLEV